MSLLNLCLVAAATFAAHADDAPGPAATTVALAHASIDAGTTAELAERPILAHPAASKDAAAAAPIFKHYGVNPTIDTSEQASSSFSIDLDTASYQLTAAELGRGELPPTAAVRVEEFLQSLSRPPGKPLRGRSIAIDVASTVSVQRPGYQVLRISIDAPPAPDLPLDLVLAVDTSPGMSGRAHNKAMRELVASIVGKLAPEDRIAVVRLGAKVELGLKLTAAAAPEARKRRILAALRRPPDTKKEVKLRDVFNLLDKTDRSRHVVYIGTGVLNGQDTPAAREVIELATAASNRGVTTSVLGVGPAPYDDVSLERLASAGRGAYRFVRKPAAAGEALVADARRPIVAVDGKVMVRFAPEAVIRYRLIGYENRSTSRPGAGATTRRSGLRSGNSITALYEVKVSDTSKAWGSVEFAFAPPEGGPSKRIARKLRRLPTDVEFEDTDPRSALAIVASGMAEKLRGSYWCRTLGWDDILKLHASLPPPLLGTPEVAELGRLVEAAKAADIRADPYESTAPAADMDFDKLPVIE